MSAITTMSARLSGSWSKLTAFCQRRPRNLAAVVLLGALGGAMIGACSPLGDGEAGDPAPIKRGSPKGQSDQTCESLRIPNCDVCTVDSDCKQECKYAEGMDDAGNALCRTATCADYFCGSPPPVDPGPDPTPPPAPGPEGPGGGGYVHNRVIRGTAWQSSTEFGADANRASDRNRDGNFHAGSVSHTTREQDPWWATAVENTDRHETIVITNRTDCCRERLGEFEVQLRKNGRWVYWKTVNGNGRQKIEVSVVGAGWFDGVAILAHGETWLHLAEVEVYGPS